MNVVFEGILLGLTLSFIFGWGPALFALIQTSIHRGFVGGVLLAFGIFLSDLALIGMGLLGAVQLFYKPDNQFLFGLIGGVILIVFGLVTYTRKVPIKAPVDNSTTVVVENHPGPLTYILKGFFINFTNPFVWIFWMGLVVGFTTNYEGSLVRLLTFFSAALLTIFSVDVLKCFSAYKIKRFIKAPMITWINRFAGVGLALFGIYLIIRTLLTLNVM
jgi:threonine/homoserine/homoserine lactone efflux protein